MRSRSPLCLFTFIVCTLLGGVAAGIHSSAEGAANNCFVLLHSTLGYERRGTKQALIRAVRSELNRPDAIDLSASSAVLISADGVRTRYRLEYAGKTFGSHWWRVDFSSFDRSGHDFQLIVKLKPTGDRGRLELRSDPFPIGDDVLFRTTFRGLALENAQARKAPPTMGGGYFDCNTRMGEAYSHAMYAGGLLAVLERRHTELAPHTQRKLVEFAEIALDYVVRLQEQDGRIVDQHYSRPFQGFNPGLVNTTLGIYGLARGALVLQAFDAAKSKRYLNAAEQGFEYLRFRKSDADMVTLAALLYRATRKEDYLEDATSYARFFSRGAERLAAGERSLEALPYNEGLMDLVELAPHHPDWTRWVHQLLDHGVQLYREAPSQNVFHISPWDSVGQAPTELIPFGSCRTSHFSRVAYSALRLAELFPASVWEPTATASLQWVAGLNYGLPGDRIIPPSTNPIASASFIINTGTRYAKQLTAELQWQVPTIVNGFTDRFRYENTWQAAETFILHDGLWLMAVSRYAALPRLTLHTTCAGKPCPTRYKVRLGNENIGGTTDRSTGRAEIPLPAWGEGVLLLSGAAGEIHVPFYASMGSHITQRVDLQEHLMVSIQPRNVKGMLPLEAHLEVRNTGKKPSKAHICVQVRGATLEGPRIPSVTLQGGESRSFLLRFTPSSATFLLVARVDWKYGSQWTGLYGFAKGAMFPIRIRTH